MTALPATAAPPRGTCQIILADAFETLARMSDGSVDHVITDPPYTTRSVRARTNKRSAEQTGTGGQAAIDWALTPEQLAELTAQCVRVARRWVIMFCELESIGLIATHPAYVKCGIWDRHSTPQITGDRPAQPGEGLTFLHAGAPLLAALDAAAESGDLGPDPEAEHPEAMALLHREGRKRWNGGGKRGIWRHPIVRGAQRAHPAQKPGGLILDLISDFTDPGDSVLDPFSGSGTIPIVAAGAGRNGYGFERDPDHYRRSIARAAGRADWTTA